MITMRIPVSEDMCDYIESLNYSVEAMRTLLCDAAERRLQDSPAFSKWEQQYKDITAEFLVAKATLEKKYVAPVIGDATVTWDLDYATCLLTIKEADHVQG